MPDLREIVARLLGTPDPEPESHADTGAALGALLGTGAGAGMPASQLLKDLRTSREMERRVADAVEYPNPTGLLSKLQPGDIGLSGSELEFPGEKRVKGKTKTWRDLVGENPENILRYGSAGASGSPLYHGFVVGTPQGGLKKPTYHSGTYGHKAGKTVWDNTLDDVQGTGMDALLSFQDVRERLDPDQLREAMKGAYAAELKNMGVTKPTRMQHLLARTRAAKQVAGQVVGAGRETWQGRRAETAKLRKFLADDLEQVMKGGKTRSDWAVGAMSEIGTKAKPKPTMFFRHPDAAKVLATPEGQKQFQKMLLGNRAMYDATAAGRAATRHLFLPDWVNNLLTRGRGDKLTAGCVGGHCGVYPNAAAQLFGGGRSTSRLKPTQLLPTQILSDPNMQIVGVAHKKKLLDNFAKARKLRGVMGRAAMGIGGLAGLGVGATGGAGIGSLFNKAPPPPPSVGEQIKQWLNRTFSG